MTTNDTEKIESLDVGIDWMKSTGFAVQIDSNDLVHVTDIDRESGIGIVRVFESTHPDAAVIFEGTLNVFAHIGLAPDHEMRPCGHPEDQCPAPGCCLDCGQRLVWDGKGGYEHERKTT